MPDVPARSTHFTIWRVGLGLAVVAAIASRVAVVCFSDGLLYPDEVYQSAEQAHRVVFGFGFVPWEWAQGARHPLLAWLLAVWLKLVPGAPDVTVRLAFALLGGLTTWPLALLARALGGTVRTSLSVALAWAFAGWPVLLGARGLSEVACALPLTWGVLFLVRGDPLRAAAALSTAVMFRLHCALVPLAALPWVFAAWPRPNAIRFCLGLLIGVVTFGALDGVAWGVPFHSAFEYLRFNLFEGRASEFGIEPPSYYAFGLARALGGFLALSAAALLSRSSRLPGLVVLVLVATHVFQPHKELRFLLPVLPLVLAMAGSGLARVGLIERLAPMLTLSALLTQPMPWQFSLRMLAIPLEPQSGPAWDLGGSCNRLLRVAGQHPDVCGLRLEGQELGYTLGYTAFHRAAPLYDHRSPPAPLEAWNVVLAPTQTAPPGRLLGTDGSWSLVLLREHCTAVPFDWRLP